MAAKRIGRPFKRPLVTTQKRRNAIKRACLYAGIPEPKVPRSLVKVPRKQVIAAVKAAVDSVTETTKAKVKKDPDVLFVKKRRDSTTAEPKPLTPVNAAPFLPGNVAAVVNLIKRGFSDQDICEVFRVPPSLLSKWCKVYPEFKSLMGEARLDADGLVIRSLHKRATGYTYKEQAPTRNGIVTLKKHMPADVNAGKFWLTNRPNTRDQWQDRRALDVDARVQVEDRREAIDAVVELLRNPDAVRLNSSSAPLLERQAADAPDTATARDDNAAPPDTDTLAELAR